MSFDYVSETLSTPHKVLKPMSSQVPLFTIWCDQVDQMCLFAYSLDYHETTPCIKATTMLTEHLTILGN